MKYEKKLKNKIRRLNDEQLLAFINDHKNNKSFEIFIAKKELDVRKYLNHNNDNKEKNNSKIREIHIPFYLRIDFKSVFLFCCSALLGVTPIIWYNCHYIPDIDYNKYNILTNGKIRFIKENTGPYHSADGASIITHSYTIKYNYYDNDSIYYTKSSIVNNTQVNRSYIRYLNKELKNGYIPIRYDSKNPNKSVIDRKALNK